MKLNVGKASASLDLDLEDVETRSSQEPNNKSFILPTNIYAIVAQNCFLKGGIVILELLIGV